MTQDSLDANESAPPCKKTRKTSLARQTNLSDGAAPVPFPGILATVLFYFYFGRNYA
jgi:hypothetical protein